MKIPNGKTIIVTLFEGDYHLGAAVLINSLCAAGFNGVVVCGHRGPEPVWAKTVGQAGEIEVHFVPLSTTVHLTNYKPEFILHVWNTLYPSAARIFYFDPDIVVKIRWSFFEEWVGYGVALCEDVNSPLPETHPRRAAWRRCLGRTGTPVRRDTPLYVNGGFIGVSRAQEPFLLSWTDAMRIVGQEIGGLERSMFSFAGAQPDMESPAYPFSKTDQDALNIALMTSPQAVSVMGPDAMDFCEGGWTMAHALGPEKPWRKSFLSAALAGRPPSRADRAFWVYAHGPLTPFSTLTLHWRRAALAAGSLIGRFCRRA